MKSNNNDFHGASLSLGQGQSFHVENNRILVECIPDKDTYSASIVLIKPETVRLYSRTGFVRQLGQTVNLKKFPLGIGAKVHYTAYEGQDLELNKKDMKILIPDNLLCVEEN